MTIEKLRPMLLDHSRWKARHRLIEELVRARLDTLNKGESLSTTALIESLWPVADVGTDELALKQRTALITNVLKLASESLSDCAFKDMEQAPRNKFGKQWRPWAWRAGTVEKRPICSCCAGKGWLTADEQRRLAKQEERASAQEETEW